MRSLTLALCLSMFFIVGCGRVDEDELPGTYSVDYEFGSEKLFLGANGKYVQYVIVGDSSLVHEGHWRYEPTHRVVLLERALDVCGDFGKQNPDWATPLRNDLMRSAKQWFPWRPVMLMVDEDIALAKLPNEGSRPGAAE